MAAGRLLIIAIDEDLRRSLAFSLTTHGHTVSTSTSAAQAPAEGFDCTIIDEDAARALGTAGREAFYRHRAPVLLLQLDPAEANPPGIAATVRKPLRGDDIVQAVGQALQSDATT